MKTVTLTICACLLTLSLGWSSLVWGDVVTDWNAKPAKLPLAHVSTDSTNRGCMA